MGTETITDYYSELYNFKTYVKPNNFFIYNLYKNMSQ